MNFVRHLFSSSRTSGRLAIQETPLPLNFSLSSFRWHLDSRPPIKSILIHDLFSSSLAWQQLLHESLSRLPLSRLTPKVPLELYALDLRGHNFSNKLPCSKEEINYTLSCAADIVLHQQEVIRSDAKLVGIGFGALVASQAALHSPESGFESLTLIINNPSQLISCDPLQYYIPSIIKNVPKDIKTLMELNQYLKKLVPNKIERALLLCNAEQQQNNGISFRFNENILNFSNTLQGATDIGEDATFSKRVTVVNCGNEEFSQEAKDRFTWHFPRADFIQFKGDRSAGISGLYSQSDDFTRVLLEAMDILDEIVQDETMQENA